MHWRQRIRSSGTLGTLRFLENHACIVGVVGDPPALGISTYTRALAAAH
ncbi:MAG: hypothetical protein IPG71_03840 [bacterium]|nr:hypothetical protein [bacterium]